MARTDARSPRTECRAIALQDAPQGIWDKKYRLKNGDSMPVGASVDGIQQRVVRAFADVEDKASYEHWYGHSLWAPCSSAIPAGRVTSNVGALGHKPATSTINCTVSGTIQGSIDHILERVHEAGLTFRASRGIDHEFNTLRPRGAYVSGAEAYTNGPLSFMGIYDKMRFTVSSADGCRGTQMGTFDVNHPDVCEFIHARREDGRLRQFNLSLLITDQFMQTVEQDADWPLVFPVRVEERNEIDLNDSSTVVWREWPTRDNYVQRADGMVACKVYGQVRARYLWDMIMVPTYDYVEPGFVLIDRVNELNNNWWCEAIRVVDPCGEQPLPPYGSYLLGSVNLTCFAEQPFGSEVRFDWDRFREVVRVFTRMLDSVVEINGLPLEQQRQEILGKRRHSMDFLGLGSTLILPKLRYGSPEACVFTEEVAREIALVGWGAVLGLAREEGPAPILAQDYEVTVEILRERPEMAADGYKAGDRVRSSVFHAKYSRYTQRVAEYAPELIEALAETDARFTYHSSITPTGTISLSLANSASNGIRPSFAHRYSCNLIREGCKTKEKVEVYSYELLAYRTLVNAQALPDNDDPAQRLPNYFITADSVTLAQHMDIQATAQKWVDSSISKTANVPTDYPFEDFRDIYHYVWHQGLKSCATFRFNPETFQGVLVKESDLKKTRYRFELEDGNIVEFKGNKQAEYSGEIHTAANLFDALKEGYYNKY